MTALLEVTGASASATEAPSTCASASFPVRVRIWAGILTVTANYTRSAPATGTVSLKLSSVGSTS